MAKVLLGDVVDRIKDKVDKDETDLEYYVGGEHIDGDEITVRRKGQIQGSTIGPAFHMRFQQGDVLLMSRNPHLRKASMVDFEGICSDVSYVCRTKDNNILLQSLLPFILQTTEFWQFAEENKKGGLPFFLNWKDFARFEFELISIDRQRKISDLLWAMERVKNAYRDLIARTEDLVKSQFIEMFGKPESALKSDVTISDVADVQVGIVIKPTRYYASDSNGIKAFRSLNIGPMSIKDDDWVYFTEEAMMKTQRTVAHTGDVLIVRSGNPGTSCVVPPEYDGCNVVDLIIAHPRPDKILPDYLCAYTNMPHGKNQIDSQQRGVAQKHFNVGMYNELKLILPSLEAQQRFVDFLNQSVKSKFAAQQTLKELTEAQKAMMKNVFK